MSLSDLLSHPYNSESSGLAATQALEISTPYKHKVEVPNFKELQLDHLKSGHIRGSEHTDPVNCKSVGALNSFQTSFVPKPLAPENHVFKEQMNLFGSLSSVLHSEDSMSSDGENLSAPKFGSPSLADLILEHKERNSLQDLCVETPQKKTVVELPAGSLLSFSHLSDFCDTLSDVPSLTTSLSSLAVTQPTAVAEPQISLSDLIADNDKPVLDVLNVFPFTETDTNIDLRSLISKPVDTYAHSLNTKSVPIEPEESKHLSYQHTYASKLSTNRKKRTHLGKTLKARPSAFALSLCFTYIPKPCRNTVLMLQSNSQDHRYNSSAVTGDMSHPALIPFDFQSPSPDDIVKESQKKAFVR